MLDLVMMTMIKGFLRSSPTRPAEEKGWDEKSFIIDIEYQDIVVSILPKPLESIQARLERGLRGIEPLACSTIAAMRRGV